MKVSPIFQLCPCSCSATVCVLHFVLHFFLLIKCALFRIILLCCEKILFFAVPMTYGWKYSNFLVAKSKVTGIRLRGDTFGDSQSSKMNSTPHLTIYKAYHLKKNKNTITYFNWSLSSPMGLEPPRSFPISWYCKLDTGMQQPKTAPWTPNATKVAGGLAAQTLSISQNLVPTWHGAPTK